MAKVKDMLIAKEQQLESAIIAHFTISKELEAYLEYEKGANLHDHLDSGHRNDIGSLGYLLCDN